MDVKLFDGLPPSCFINYVADRTAAISAWGLFFIEF
jgi:hypothetical protein